MKETKPKSRTKSPKSQTRTTAAPPRTPKAKIPPKPKPAPPKVESEAARKQRILYDACERANRIANATGILQTQALLTIMREEHEVFDAFSDNFVYAVQNLLRKYSQWKRAKTERDSKVRGVPKRPLVEPRPGVRSPLFDNPDPLPEVAVSTWLDWSLPIKHNPTLRDVINRGEEGLQLLESGAKWYRSHGESFLRRATFVASLHETLAAGKQLTEERIERCAEGAGVTKAELLKDKRGVPQTE